MNAWQNCAGPGRIDAAVLPELAAWYGYADVRWETALGGISATNALVIADGRRLVLKCYRGGLDKVHRVELVTGCLKAAGFPVVPACAGRDGLQHFVSEGRYYALFPFVEGRILHESTLDAAALQSAARCLSSLHSAAISRDLPLQRTCDRTSDPPQALGRAHAILSRIGRSDDPVHRVVAALVRLKAEILAEIIAQPDHTPLSQEEFIHGDFHNENLLFDKRHAVTAILDLEHARFGDHVEDLVTFINLACCNTGYGASNIHKARFFVKAYRVGCPLPPERLAGGFQHCVRELASSFFLEETVLAGSDLAAYIARDISRLHHLRRHLLPVVAALM